MTELTVKRAETARFEKNENLEDLETKFSVRKE
jgi:hypothetical protein